MSPKVLNIGFIGGGINSAIGTTHKIASQMDNKFRLISGSFSRNKDINLKTINKWLISSYYTNYIDFLDSEKENLDAVVILTPTDSHTQIILNTLNRNLPIICEKTLTNSLDDAFSIRERLKHNNGFLLTTYNYTGYPMIRELENMITKGRLGDIIQINIQMPQESFIRLDKDGNISRPQAWRLKDTNISTLSLDLGTHLSNMVSFLTKEKPQEVIAMQNQFGHHSVIDNLICMIKYTNNIDCQMWYSKSALGHKNGLKVEVYGDKGSASWYQMNPEFLEYNDNVGRNIILDRSSKEIEIANQDRYNRFKSGHPAGFIEAFANLYTDIFQKLEQYKKDNNHHIDWTYDALQATVGLEVFEAIQQSYDEHKWIHIKQNNYISQDLIPKRVT